jgi:hypothetical protein
VGKPIPGTLPHTWIYCCSDLECGTLEEAEMIARGLVPATGELLEILDVASGTVWVPPNAPSRKQAVSAVFAEGTVSGRMTRPAARTSPTAASKRRSARSDRKGSRA